MKKLIASIQQNKSITKEELNVLLNTKATDIEQYLFSCARETADNIYGKDIYIRGLIEFTNFCKNNCYYCGLRRDNKSVERYRLNKENILDCCKKGYDLGFRTFVSQGGEDAYFTDEKICSIVSNIKENFPDCAVTLSIGEKEKHSYLEYFKAGADRYLLRHETANNEHYSRLHPAELSLNNRKRCLYDLKEIGYQTGCGFMVGSPYQTIDNLYEDLIFIKELSPHMVGIGPFIPQSATPFKNKSAGSFKTTLRLLAIIRLMNPHVLLPATTALGTIHPKGRELGILAGANVIMPNLSPVNVREKYTLYDNKLCTGKESAEGLNSLKKCINEIGYNIVCARGDFRGENNV